MKSLTLFLLLAFTAREARAEEILRFTADVRDEALSEEAIELVHCLAERTGKAWEFDGEARGTLWVRFREEGRRLKGTYRHGEREETFALGASTAEETCARLEPAPPSVPAPPPPAAGVPSGLSALDTEPDDESPKKAWLWAAAGLAAVGGFLLWKAKRPTYGSVEMR